MDRRTQLAFVLSVSGLLCLAVAIAMVVTAPNTNPGATNSPALRLGDPVALFDRLLVPHSQAHDVGPRRRLYDLPDSRLFLDLTASGRVRQITIGRERNAPETWMPDPDDWSIAQAERLARAWLPPDATLKRTEPFSFREKSAGKIEVYACPSLRSVFAPHEAASLGARSPGDMCAVTYYQTENGGIAFVLVGLY